jgi:hypothetical protein
MDWARYNFSRSIEARPIAVLITIGKKAIRKAIRTFGSRLKPNHTINSGPTATFGTACDATRTG